MTEIAMNDTEKQVFSQICSGNVIRKTLINVITERNICSVPTLDRIIKKFQKGGLLLKGKRGEFPLTEDGRKEKKRMKTKPTVAFKNSGLAKVIAKLPTEAHQGLIYFILATIVAKKYLAEKLGDKGIWGNFIISGRPKDIKTLLGEIVCRTLDLPFETHIQRCLGKSEAQVLGEATLIEDGLRKLRLPPYLLYLFIVWDDLDKASTRGAWNALMVYLDGRYKFEERYTPITKQVTTLATMNPKKKGGFDMPDHYLRRAFTVNSAKLPCDQKENERIGADISDNPIPKLKTDGLVVAKEFLEPDEKDFIRNLLYDRWITEEAKGVVDANLLHAVVLGMLILQESIDVRYYSYWAVLHYLCFLHTLDYTKGNWQEELTQEWGDYASGSGGDEKFKKEWEEQAKKIKEEKDKIDKGKKDKIDKGEGDKAVKKGEEKARGSKYVTKMSKLMEIRDSFAEIEKKKRVSEILIWLDKDIKDLKIKKGESASEDRITELTMTLNEWEEQHKPIREAWEEEQKNLKEAKDRIDQYFRYLKKLKGVLISYFGRGKKDKNGTLWSHRTEEVREDIGKILNPETRKKFFNKPFLDSTEQRARVLLTERKQQREEAKTKKAGLVEMPQVLSGVFDDLTQEESAEVIEEAVGSLGVGEPSKTTRTVPLWKALLIKLDRRLKRGGRVKPRPRTIDEQIDYEIRGGKRPYDSLDPTQRNINDL